MLRFWLSLVFFLGSIIYAILSVGGYIPAYINTPSFLIVGIVPLIFLGIIYGFKEMFFAFSIPFKKENDQNKLLKSYNFFKVYGKLTWIIGFIYFTITFLAILRNLENRAHLGPNLALALISLLYSAIINGVIVLPNLLKIKKQMQEK